ncbi:MAG: hypothetical protein KAG14_05185 [Mycoplasmataceae bacterium]|nr:hypothetical protein [Mycoplasmataceae bacterium]
MTKLLLDLYCKELKIKQIDNEMALNQIITIDREKIIYALNELRYKTTHDLTDEFFNHTPEIVSDIMAEISHSYLYHIGMESNCPLEITLYGFKQQIAYFNRQLDDKLEMTRVLIFPASQAFQQRVNAYTEVMRVWIKMSHGEYMLEFFNIHRPIVLSKLMMQHKKEIRDDIWHYALYINQAKQVKQLHQYCYNLSLKNTDYKLPFESVINNKNDGSVLTKIINKQKKLEIEFVTGTFVTGPIPSASLRPNP